MTNPRPTVTYEDQPEGPAITPGMKRGCGSGPAYYNELNPSAAAWLAGLMADGLIPEGTIDTRSISEVQPDDLIGYATCHFFAGIGGWPLALRLAGWPDDRPVWTGSCPCQPFSNAGKGRGTADERHLWPDFARLIAKRRPATVFGEQVASRSGREWLAGVFVDLERMGYAGAGADLCAAGLGAPHSRQRAFWVGDADSFSTERQCGQRISLEPKQEAGRSGNAVRWAGSVPLQCSGGRARRFEPGILPVAHGLPRDMGSLSPRLRRLAEMAGLDDTSLKRAKAFRKGQIDGYGNAIVPDVAARFITAYMEATA